MLESPSPTVFSPPVSARRATRVGVNRVKDGLTLSALRATSGGPVGAEQTSAILVRPDGGRRNASLFDLPSSGEGLVSRLRAQVRPSSPLLGLATQGRDPVEALSPGGDGAGSLWALDSANAIQASLRSSFLRIDSQSRQLLSAASANRTSGGFGLASITNAAIDLFG